MEKVDLNIICEARLVVASVEGLASAGSTQTKRLDSRCSMRIDRDIFSSISYD